MTRGYLLDTNIVKYWFDETTPEHKKVLQHLETLDPKSPLMISAISWGEIEYGHRCESQTDARIQVKYKGFISKRLPNVLPIDRHTSHDYGQIRASLFDKFASKKKKGLRPCQLVDPVTAISLGIQENDLWIAAQAIEFNLVLVTHDRMNRLREVTPNLLEIEDWAI